MLIRKPKSDRDLYFAWLPVWTPSGRVWLEFVRRTFQQVGLGGYSYERLNDRPRTGVSRDAWDWWLSLSKEERIKLRTEWSKQ